MRDARPRRRAGPPRAQRQRARRVRDVGAFAALPRTAPDCVEKAPTRRARTSPTARCREDGARRRRAPVSPRPGGDPIAPFDRRAAATTRRRARRARLRARRSSAPSRRRGRRRRSGSPGPGCVRSTWKLTRERDEDDLEREAVRPEAAGHGVLLRRHRRRRPRRRHHAPRRHHARAAIIIGDGIEPPPIIPICGGIGGGA